MTTNVFDKLKLLRQSRTTLATTIDNDPRAKLERLDAELAEAEAEAARLAAEQAEAARLDRVKELRRQENAAFKSIVSAVVELESKINDLSVIHVSLASEQEFPLVTAYGMPGVVRAILDAWSQTPAGRGALGLFPLPTIEEVAVEEARGDVERAKQLLKAAGELKGWNARSEWSERRESELTDAIVRLRAAEERLRKSKE